MSLQPDEEGRPKSWRDMLRSLRVAGMAWLAARIATIVGAWIGAVLIPGHNGKFLSPRSFGLVKTFFIWDSNWYQSIVVGGYSWSGPKAGEQNVAFFPLYPLVTKIVSLPFPIRREPTIQLLVAWTAFFCALVAFHLLAIQELPDVERADQATFFLALLPGALFYFMGYSEALFLLCTVLAFLFARRGRWWPSGASALLAGLTRIMGSFLCIPLAFEWWQQRREQKAPLLAPEVLSLGAGPLGLALFIAYLDVAVHDPMAWMKAQHIWRPSTTWFLGALSNDIFGTMARSPWWALLPTPARNIPNSIGFDWLMMLLTVALVGAAARRLRWGYIVWTALLILVPLQTGTSWNMVRFTAVAFPAALAYGFLVKSPRVHTLWIATSVGLLVLATAFSISGGAVV